ncbi:hypothetical protein QJS10_CPB12g00554 [Acorus calamus]|uniref:Uncharacterized protein n=1 Tax=Acorus calamus TaxID=4465 RepID=A0AAV9DIN5_ACOCL|nr:hypothetical protein QJS10_CPB12g00554 [Acorus calamus]
MAGCTAALMACNMKSIMQVWFYEHTRLRTPSAYGLVPRFFRWGRMNDKSSLLLLRTIPPPQSRAGRMTEGYVIDAYFDLLKERIQDNPEVHRACLFGKHFARLKENGQQGVKTSL